MSFPGTNQRRFNAGGAPASPSARPPRDGGDGGGEKKSKWTTVGCFYDPWHASLEPQVLTEWFKTGLGLKVAPVFPDRAGSEPGAAGTPKYDHDSAVMLLLKLEEVLTFRYQLAAFLSGALSEVIITRDAGAGPVKRLILTSGEAYYEPAHPEYEERGIRGSLVLALEQDASNTKDELRATFFCRPLELVLADGQEGTVIYPELQALLAILDSYLSNCARVDFGSIRLLDNVGGGAPRAAGVSTAAQPTRRGLGAQAPAPGPEYVSEEDIGSALGGDDYEPPGSPQRPAPPQRPAASVAPAARTGLNGRPAPVTTRPAAAPRPAAPAREAPGLDDVLGGDGIPNF